MTLCQIIWLYTKPYASQRQPNYQKLADRLVIVGWHMASCKQDYLAKWHFLLFLWYILIFWAQKCWFIELKLTLDSDAVWFVWKKPADAAKYFGEMIHTYCSLSLAVDFFKNFQPCLEVSWDFLCNVIVMK